MDEIALVAFLIFMTSLDTMILIKRAVPSTTYPSSALNILILLIMGTMHPLYSYLVDSFRYVPGLRLMLAVALLYFAYKMAMEQPRRAQRSVRSHFIIMFRIIWIDLITSVDTMILVSQASPSLNVTLMGNVLGVGLLITFASLILRGLHFIPWIQLIIAGYMAFTALTQLRYEMLLADFLPPFVYLYLGVGTALFISTWGWFKVFRGLSHHR